MNNKEFISALARDTGYGISDTQRVVISNFGCFEVKKKLERIMINPSTQQRMLVPPKLVLGFKPNTSWKDKLKTESKDK